MLFLTYNDPPSGIYFSQVTDVCNFLNARLNANIRLVALLSLRAFWKNRRRIKSQVADSIVLPMIPGVRNWKLNYFLLWFLFLFVNSKKVIARGPFAASLAIKLKKTGVAKCVVFDGRGASHAEFNEYNVAKSEKLNFQISRIEKNAVLNSDFRIAVSNKLVEYWRNEMNYSQNNHVVIPCTYHSDFFKKFPDEARIQEMRKSLGYTDEDILFVYSGSSAGWQSLDSANNLLFEIMKKNSKVKLLFLSKKNISEMKIAGEFKDRVKGMWMDEMEVHSVLCCCDYGILVREKSVTNNVSSPVKFAEYLASGLKIIISENVGDYTEFVKNNNCGIVTSIENKIQIIEKPTPEMKKYMRKLALDNFSKEGHLQKYKQLLN